MTWLHTWSGLLLGWVAYAIFVTGTASYFKPEITRWMQPELPHSAPLEAARTAVAALEKRAPEASRWIIDVPDERARGMPVYWQPRGGGRFQTESIDPMTAEKSAARGSMGGEFFYRFHFQLLLPHPWGRYTAGVVALALFVALFTGIVAHRRFFADMFLFRPGRVALRSWLDFHNVAGVLTLPFFLMITYSGLVIFNSLYFPWPGKVLPLEKSVARAAPGGWVAPAPVTPMLEEAARRWGSVQTVDRIEATDRGTIKALVTFTRGAGHAVSIRSRDQLKFDGITGTLIDDTRMSATDGPARGVHSVLYGLHMARFAGPLLRGLLFFLGLLGTALIASGLIMWTIKRRPKLVATSASSRIGFWLVERLNVTAMAGLFIAIAALFWANRLLPIELPARADREILCFLAAWGAALLHACLRPAPRAWREQLLFAATLFVLVPALDALFAGPYLAAAGRALDLAYLGFDLFAIVLGIGLAVAAGKVGRRVATVAPPGAANKAAVSEPEEVCA